LAKKKTPLELGRRERQIYETLEKLGEASVQDVLEHIADPPTYTSVRTMLNVLARKGWAVYRRDGRRFLYRPAKSESARQKSYVRQMLDLCFGGHPDQAMMALLDHSGTKLTDEELDEIEAKIEEVRRKKGKR
jgi:predicted transcriptional regulator